MDKIMQRPAELSVFRSKDAGNVGARLQKQKSLTNLTLLSEGGKRRYSYRDNWFGNASKSSQASQQREGELGSRGLLSKVLSKSAHSLYNASNKSPWEAEELLPAGGRKLSKRLRGYPSDETDQGEKSKLGDGNVSVKPKLASQNWAAEEEGCLREGTAQLDEDVIMTMLEDLEQALYHDILGESHLFDTGRQFRKH